MKPRAWWGDPALKDRTIATVQAVRDQGALIQRRYVEPAAGTALGFRACAIGAVVQPRRGLVTARDWLDAVEEEFGIPSRISHLVERIYDRLPSAQSEHAIFATEWLAAIPVGADLTDVHAAFTMSALSEYGSGVHSAMTRHEVEAEATKAIVAWYECLITAEDPYPRQVARDVDDFCRSTAPWYRAFAATFLASNDQGAVPGMTDAYRLLAERLIECLKNAPVRD